MSEHRPPNSPTRIQTGVVRPAAVEIVVDGIRLTAHPGETLAAALLAGGRRTFRQTASGDPRGPFCNMGVCFECLVTVDGEAGRRACMTPVREGMSVETGADDGAR